MNTTMSFIGGKIKEIRIAANFSQQKVGEYLGVDQSLVSKYETGERAVSTDVLEKLANLFCCPVTAFMQEDETAALSHAFRSSELDAEDLQNLALMNRIALNLDLMGKLVEV